jgi:hypothetical protein
MKDEIERADGLLGDGWRRAFYPSSLLYFVSGLLEDEVDAPILGMERFLIAENLFGKPAYPACEDMRLWFGQVPYRLVWSIDEAIDGRGSASRKHGDFDNEEITLRSLTWMVQN